MTDQIQQKVASEQTGQTMILVWDLPVRVFHWLLVICFAGAWLTSESERLQMIHYAFGYTTCLLVCIRLLWGLFGTRYARFSQFLKGPKAVFDHFLAMLRLKPHQDVGHNPAGGLVMIVLMLLILLIGLSGYMSVKEVFGDFSSEFHESVSHLALALVILHILAAVIMSILEKQNLIRAMVNGKKRGLPNQAILFPQYLIGTLIFVGSLYFFYLVISGALPGLTQ
jgi:cytochrome b